MQTETAARTTRGRLCAALVTVRGRVALVIGGESRWRRDPGCVLIPLELPGGSWPEGSSPEAAIAAIGRHWLGNPLHPLDADVTYGPSARHAIDRLPPQNAPAPLLYLERLAPADPERNEGVHRIAVAVYRAATDGAVGSADKADALEPRGECAGLLLLSWQALRQILRGLPLGDLLAREDVTVRLRPGVSLPSEALVYLTAEYGERTLLRVTAKYGMQALGKDADDGTGV
ncbi:MAG TPA: hypothetical protein VFW76_10815 [Ktedonobacterales bacterium]|nr:hypothetical protein [Ktedonobacterales bacterium]